MALIDPIQLMTTLGTAPERSSRRTAGHGAQEFATHLRAASDENDAASLGGTPLENSLMQDALNTLAGFMPTSRVRARVQKMDMGTAPTETLGALSATFESGSAGIHAIGYDRNGGTSYGTYQIASKPGSMKQFIRFLETEEPAWAARLQDAGPANTGSTRGRMPAVWKALAAENPERLGELQRTFIARTHYEPARSRIQDRTGLDMNTMPQAMQEALWSTAVQHGPAGAAKIFSSLIATVPAEQRTEDFSRQLIAKVYDDRTSHFGASTERVRASIGKRMSAEKELILAMLDNPGEQSA